MLNKKNRLQKDSSFRATYYQNRVVQDEFFVLYAGKNKQDNNFQTKIGFVVSKKIHKRAVVRNKIKRRLRFACAAYLKEKEVPFISLIFKAKPESISACYTDTLKSVYNLSNRMARKFV